MNCYDFDKTIYKKDSAIKFYFFALSKKPLYMIFHLFYVCFLTFLHALHIINTGAYKERFFSFLKKFKNKEDLVSKFWDKEIKNINSWYLTQKKDDDVICSASPEFLVKEAMQRINPNAQVVCTLFDLENCVLGGG